MDRTRAVVFDLYGTLVDVRSVTGWLGPRFGEQAGPLAELWRRKQLEYTWLDSLMGRFRDFEEITREAFEAAARALAIPVDRQMVEEAGEAYLRLPAFPEVAQVLARLTDVQRVVLSNGTVRMIEATLKQAGIAGYFDAVLSTEQVRLYKPHPEVYRLAVDQLGIRPEEVLFVSANYWDAAGAKNFGFSVVWVNRTGAPPDGLAVQPDHVVDSLKGVLALVLPTEHPRDCLGS